MLITVLDLGPLIMTADSESFAQTDEWHWAKGDFY
jgi:hypothetical protein